MPSIATKLCEQCGCSFPRNRKYGKVQWEQARFCSNRCRGAAELKRPLCACGCGERVIYYHARYRRGHNPNSYQQRTWIYSKPLNRWYVIDRQGKRVFWYRIVMEDKLGRALEPSEVVHHIDGNSANDELDNLQLFASNGEHLRYELSGRVTQEMACNG